MVCVSCEQYVLIVKTKGMWYMGHSLLKRTKMENMCRRHSHANFACKNHVWNHLNDHSITWACGEKSFKKQNEIARLNNEIWTAEVGQVPKNPMSQRFFTSYNMSKSNINWAWTKYNIGKINEPLTYLNLKTQKFESLTSSSF